MVKRPEDDPKTGAEDIILPPVFARSLDRVFEILVRNLSKELTPISAYILLTLLNEPSGVLSFTRMSSDGYRTFCMQDVIVIQQALDKRKVNMELYFHRGSDGRCLGFGYFKRATDRVDEADRQRALDDNLRAQIDNLLTIDSKTTVYSIVTEVLDDPEAMIPLDFVAEKLTQELIESSKLSQRQKELLLILRQNDHVITYYELVQLDQMWRTTKNISGTNNLGNIRDFLKSMGLQIIMPSWNNFSLGIGLTVLRGSDAEEVIGTALQNRFCEVIIRDFGRGEEEFAEGWYEIGDRSIAFPQIELGNRTMPFIAIVAQRFVHEGNVSWNQQVIRFTSKEQFYVFRSAVVNHGYIDDKVLALTIKREEVNISTRIVDNLEKINAAALECCGIDTMLGNLLLSSGYKGYAIDANPQNRVRYICEWLLQQMGGEGPWWEDLNKFEPLFIRKIENLNLEFGVFSLQKIFSSIADDEKPWSISKQNPFLFVVIDTKSQRFTVMEISASEVIALEMFKSGQSRVQLGNFRGIDKMRDEHKTRLLRIKKEELSDRVRFGMQWFLEKLMRRGYRWHGVLQEKGFEVELNFPHFDL